MNEQLALTPTPTTRPRTTRSRTGSDGPVVPTRPRGRIDARTRAIGLAGVRAARARLRRIAEAEAAAEGRVGPAPETSTDPADAPDAAPDPEADDDPAGCRRVA